MKIQENVSWKIILKKISSYMMICVEVRFFKVTENKCYCVEKILMLGNNCNDYFLNMLLLETLLLEFLL